MAYSFNIVLCLSLLLLQTYAARAQTPDPFIGTWESTGMHFRLVIYREQNVRQILFYGRIETTTQQSRYVTLAENIQNNASTLLFDLPAHAVYSNGAQDSALAGHQSELPAKDQVETITRWRLGMNGNTLQLDCALAKRDLCGLRSPVKLHPG